MNLLQKDWKDIKTGRCTHQQTCLGITDIGIAITILKAIDKTVYSLTIADLDARMNDLKDARDV